MLRRRMARPTPAPTPAVRTWPLAWTLASAHLRRRRTYPGIFPVLHLDHIYYEGDVDVRSVELPRSRKALMASDHLPLVANLTVGFE